MDDNFEKTTFYHLNLVVKKPFEPVMEEQGTSVISGASGAGEYFEYANRWRVNHNAEILATRSGGTYYVRDEAGAERLKNEIEIFLDATGADESRCEFYHGRKILVSPNFPVPPGIPTGGYSWAEI